MTEPSKCIGDVAEWFLNKESLQPKKLQKLCYYAVAWHYALLNEPLCKDDIFQAWVHGPVNKTVYDRFKNYVWQYIPRCTDKPDFGASEEVLELVWGTYKNLSGTDLEYLSHSELPWKNARGDLPEYEPSENLISVDDMKTYYREVYEKTQND